MTQPSIRAALAAAALLALGAAQADNFDKATFEGARDDIHAAAKADRESCGALSGNARDVCLASAKGRETVALAQLQYDRTGSEKDGLKLMEAQYEARYDVAKERCDDLSGQRKDLCLQEARTQRDKDAADVKLGKKVTAAFADADQAKLKADYRLARERCDMLSGRAKESCLAAVKARYRPAADDG